MNQNTRRKHGTAAILTAVAAAAAPLSGADDANYQFIVSGDPDEVAVANSSFDESLAVALDGVSRTVAESQMTYLYTDKKGPVVFMLK